MTDGNRDKFIQIAKRYGQQLKFYNVEELCADRFAQISEYFPDIYADRHSIATFYRFFIQHLLLPQGIEKAIYLDSDTIVNLDIAELWQIELYDKPFGAISEFYQIKDKDASIKNQKKHITICGEGVVNPEDYFNSGVMLLNLKVLRDEEPNILAGMKFVSEHPQFRLLDQDILNYCFSTTYLKLPLKFNRFVVRARREDEWTIEKKLYHFVTNMTSFIMDSRDPYSQLFMDYFLKTPWVDADTAAVLTGGLSSRKCHAVSVVIPMYNAAEFIGECLDSLLAQTFQDYEVIIVDDCSTDNSVAIVESYAPKFDGRLKLTRTEENSGGGGHVPRNIGMMLTRGEYIYFMDADDMILDTALEIFYKAAILYNAEVVYTSSWYFLRAPNDIYLIRDRVSRKMSAIHTEFTIDDPNKNLNRLLLEGSSTDSLTRLDVVSGNDLAAWTKFVHRDFIVRNKIFFANIRTSGDAIRTINMYCHARRFLRIATPLYVHRLYNTNSIVRKVRAPQEQCRFWFSSFVDFTEALYELEKENAVLAENPDYCLAALSIHLMRCLDRTEEARKELSNEELYKILHEEFAKKFSYSSAMLLPFLFSVINEKASNDFYVKVVNKFERYLTARLDIQLMSTTGDFEILSVSDKKTKIWKPAWFQKNGIGYQIHSYVGELDFTAKATVAGKIMLRLLGVDVRDPTDKTKRIPYWIDYSKLAVNGETIFDELTPAWHDKFYRYDFEAKANEEIKIHVEWQPHRSDT
ncbi:MAG: glycosyltransferase [Selenomonadaceae bacterium]|nr:glycosyltransferase [Selenomonadaceae bacterium]